jgi:hypothetical protein
MASSRLAEVVLVKFAIKLRVCEVLCKTPKQAVNLSVHKVGDVPVPGFQKYWTQKLALLKSKCLVFTNKYPEAASIVQ